MNKEDTKEFSEDPEVRKVSDVRKSKQKALAFLRRAKRANIPEENMRVNAEQFSELLDEKYIKENEKEYKELFGDSFDAKTPIDFAHYIYDNAEKLLNLNYIVIDGGNADARRRAGCALLFRFILCDKWALYKECSKLSHVFQTIHTNGTDPHRNDLANQLVKEGVIFIAEFYPNLMNIHFDTGTFFDEVFVSRRYSKKITIISFAEPIVDSNKIKNKDYGVTFADLSWQFRPGKKVLRIKVAPYESK
jgi:hypothetical protein